jgi:hypothetical protein
MAFMASVASMQRSEIEDYSEAHENRGCRVS